MLPGMVLWFVLGATPVYVQAAPSPSLSQTSWRSQIVVEQYLHPLPNAAYWPTRAAEAKVVLTIEDVTIFNGGDAQIRVRLTPYHGIPDTWTIDASNPVMGARAIRERLWIWLLAHPTLR